MMSPKNRDRQRTAEGADLASCRAGPFCECRLSVQGTPRPPALEYNTTSDVQVALAITNAGEAIRGNPAGVSVAGCMRVARQMQRLAADLRGLLPSQQAGVREGEPKRGATPGLRLHKEEDAEGR